MSTLTRLVFVMIAYASLNFMVNTSAAAAHNHQASHQAMQSKKERVSSCEGVNIICAKTVTSVFAPNGDLWRLWALHSSIYFQISTDNGGSFSAITRVAIDKEKISARNENRPKIAFDKYQGVYLSWATPKEKKYTADVRFSYSSDYGKTFTKPVTVNDDNLLTGHSFNEMLVTDEGDISIAWLDSRLAYQLRLQEIGRASCRGRV